jgi:protein TonB
VTVQIDPKLYKPEGEETSRTSGTGHGVGSGSGGDIGIGPGRGGGIGPGGGGVGPAERAAHPDAFTVSEVTKRAVIIFKPEPGYTEEARRNNVNGTVRLRVILAASGEVTNISVVKGLPDGLSEVAVAAARQMRFRPAEKDGRAVSQWAMIEYNFNLY